MGDRRVFEVMWEKAGATLDKPRPFLKTALCRVISVAAVIREQSPQGQVTLRLTRLPKTSHQPMAEAELIGAFLAYLGKQQPQLVGFNSHTSDLPILLQRGIATGVSAKEFCRRPDRPWQGTDYFARQGDSHIDLKAVMSGWGIGAPCLSELARVMGIPGQLTPNQPTIVDWWVEGNLAAIMHYNQWDALTTYLIWLRTARFAGFFDADQYAQEENRLKDLLKKHIDQGETHLADYLTVWQRLRDAGLAVAGE